MEITIPALAVSNLTHQIPPYDILSVKKYEKAYKWTLVIDEKFVPHWSKVMTLVQIDRSPMSKGRSHTCYKMTDLAQPDVEYIAKFGAANRVSRNMYFNSVIVQAASAKCAELFNEANGSNITFQYMSVLELVERNHLNNVCVAELRIKGDSAKKSVVNSPDNEEFKLIQAFGHFIIQRSNHEILVSDLQGIGGVYVNSEVHTKSGKGFFDKNQGLPALQKFAESHSCNDYCKSLKLDPINLAKISEITPIQSSTFRAGGTAIGISTNLMKAGAEKPSEKTNFVAVQKSKYLQNTVPASAEAPADDGALPGSPKVSVDTKASPKPKFFHPPTKMDSSLNVKSSPSSSPTMGAPIHINHSTPPSSLKRENSSSSVTSSSTSSITFSSSKPGTTIFRQPSIPQKITTTSSVSTSSSTNGATAVTSNTAAPNSTANTSTPNTPPSPSAPRKATESVPIENKDRGGHHEAPKEKQSIEIIPEFEDVEYIIVGEELQAEEMGFVNYGEEDEDGYDEGDDDDYDIQPLPPVPLPAKSPMKTILKKTPIPNKTRHVRWVDLVDFEKNLMSPTTPRRDNSESGGGGGGGGFEDQKQAPEKLSFATEKEYNYTNFRLLYEPKGAQAECICGDGNNIYTGSTEGQIAIWDTAQEMRVVSTFRAHNKAVKSIVLDKSTLFTGSADASIISWDTHTKKQLTKATSKSDIHALCVSDAHNLLFSAENDKTIKVWDTHTLQHVKTLTGHNRAVKALFVMGNYLFSGSNDQQIIIWNLNTHRVVKGLTGHEGWIRTIYALGTTLYTGSQDETVRLWDLNTTECFQTIQTKGPVQALLPTSKALFTAAGDHIEVWSGDSSYSCTNDLNNRSPVLCMWRKQNQLLCGSISNSLKVWCFD